MLDIIDAEEDAEVLIGTTVNSKEELENQINQDNLLESLKRLKYNRILFYSCWYHSIGSGITVYETMQFRDTYRLYDYNRQRK